jgi:acetyl esterase/lipase
MPRLLLVLIGAVCATAQQAPPTELDIHYGTGSEKQVLDLFVPAKKGFATIVYTYGGGWHSGSGKSSTPLAEKLRELGYGCALISHRLFPPDVFPAQAEDLAAAVAWVKANIAARGGDSSRIILAGHSSGAHLSLLLATDRRYLAAPHLTIGDIEAVIGLSPPVDLSRHPDGHGYGNVLLAGHGADAFERDEVVMKDASPIEHISRGLPPTLLVIGEHDFPMLEADARAFAGKAKGYGCKVQVIVAPGKDHMGVARGMLDDNGVVFEAVKTFLQQLAEQRP